MTQRHPRWPSYAEDFGGTKVPITITQCPIQHLVGRYLRNADSVGCNFCLVRQHGSATTNCSETFIVYTLQKSIFNCSSGHCNWEGSVSLIHYSFNQILNSKPGFIQPPLCSASSLPQIPTYQSQPI